jgi:hypothetical protein
MLWYYTDDVTLSMNLILGMHKGLKPRVTVLMFYLSVFSHVINSWNNTLFYYSEYICYAKIGSSV